MKKLLQKLVDNEERIREGVKLLLIALGLASVSFLMVLFLMFPTMKANPGIVAATLVAFVVWYVLMYAYLSWKKKTAWLERHGHFLTMLGVLLAAVFFYLPSVNTYLMAETRLRGDNTENAARLEMVTRELKQDPSAPLWLSYQSEGYREQRLHIDKHHSEACRTLYQSLVLRLSALESINQERQSVQMRDVTSTSILATPYLEHAEQALALYGDIRKECYKDSS